MKKRFLAIALICFVGGAAWGWVSTWGRIDFFAAQMSEAYFQETRVFVCINKRYGGASAFERAFKEWGESEAIKLNSDATEQWKRDKNMLGTKFEMCRPPIDGSAASDSDEDDQKNGGGAKQP